jgi:hypothetical protein
MHSQKKKQVHIPMLHSRSSETREWLAPAGSSPSRETFTFPSFQRNEMPLPATHLAWLGFRSRINDSRSSIRGQGTISSPVRDSYLPKRVHCGYAYRQSFDKTSYRRLARSIARFGTRGLRRNEAVPLHDDACRSHVGWSSKAT